MATTRGTLRLKISYAVSIISLLLVTVTIFGQTKITGKGESVKKSFCWLGVACMGVKCTHADFFVVGVNSKAAHWIFLDYVTVTSCYTNQVGGLGGALGFLPCLVVF